MVYRFTFFLIYSTLLSNLFGQNSVVRGPYLQSVTHESIIVMWRTSNPTASTVWFGTDSLALTQSVTVNGSTTNHMVKITGLNPSNRYYYAVGYGNTQLVGGNSMHTFKTHPIPGTSVPTRVWAIGDFGRGNSGQVAVKTSYEAYTGSRGTDVWLWLGDNAYQDGKDSDYQNHVFNVPGFSDIFSYTPFWPSPGNHDYNTVWSESTLLGIPYTNIALSDHQGPYFDIVEVPRFGESGGYGSQLEVFYSFDYGDVHFLSLNSEVFDYTLSYDGINQMKAWIQNDLAQNTRKFTIAYFHQPPYSKGSHDSDDMYQLVMKAMREKIIPLLESYDIDLVICGHSHVFERSYLIKGHYGNSSSFNPATMLMNPTMGNFQQGSPYIKDGLNSTPEGTVYVVCGNSGSSESGPPLNHPVMAYTHGGSGEMGSFVVDIYKNRLDGKYIKSTGELADEFTILKKDLKLNPIITQTVCPGQPVTLQANYTGGSDSLLFVWSPGGLIGSNVNVAPTVNTTYTLTVTDQLTGQIETTQTQINILSAPTAVISEVIPGTLGVTNLGAGFTYQWLINGTPISGAISQYYAPLFNGNYTVEITSPNGCSIVTDPFSFQLSTSSINEFNDGKVEIFPNPNSGYFTIRIKEKSLGAQCRILDINGREIQKHVLNNLETQIDLNRYENGIYIVQIFSNMEVDVHSVLLAK